MHCPRPLFSYSRGILSTFLHLLLLNPGMLLPRHQAVLLSHRKQFAGVSFRRDYSSESEETEKKERPFTKNHPVIRRLARVFADIVMITDIAERTLEHRQKFDRSLMGVRS